MYLKPEVMERILGAMRERVPNWQPCAVCAQSNWQVIDGLVRIAVADDLTGPAGLGPRAMPLVAVMCNICGNTVLLNLMILGLADLVSELGARLEGQPGA